MFIAKFASQIIMAVMMGKKFLGVGIFGGLATLAHLSMNREKRKRK